MPIVVGKKIFVNELARCKWYGDDLTTLPLERPKTTAAHNAPTNQTSFCVKIWFLGPGNLGGGSTRLGVRRRRCG